jgi:hypothetical protein
LVGRPPVPAAVRFWRFVDKSEGCWEWQGAKVRGYGRFQAANRHQVIAHRYSWQMENGPIPAGLSVCHTCDNPSCVRPSHLFLGTAAENSADRDRKGRAATGDRHWLRRDPAEGQRRMGGDANPARTHRQRLVRGEAHPKARFTPEGVHEVRRALAAGEPIKQIAERYGVARFAIYSIRNGTSWGWLPQEATA